MLSFTASPINSRFWPDFFAYLNTYYVFHSNSTRYRRKTRERIVSVRFVSVSSLGFEGLKSRNFRDCFWACSTFVRRSKKGWESEGDSALEAEILEFMNDSENPKAFPTKKQLIDAGRFDLVESILKQGGWLAMGWDLDDHENQKQGIFYNVDDGRGLLRDEECHNPLNEERVFMNSEEQSNSQASFFHVDSHASASSSGRSLQTAAEDDSGIDGILHRLEKERNMNLGFGLSGRASCTNVQSDDLKNDCLAGASKNGTVAGLTRSNKFGSLSPKNNVASDTVDHIGRKSTSSSFDGHNNSLKSDMKRTWGIQGTGNSDMEFEAGEFPPNAMKSKVGDLGDEIFEVSVVSKSSPNSEEEFSCERICHNDIKSRLQHLELELSTVLKTLKSNTSERAFTIGDENTTDNLLKLSDAWEFQENEIMNAEDKLRSVRAKLAVLDGKMALAVIDAQKIVEEKQKKVDNVRRALQILRTACIVWPNPASKVLLAGSFDGWTTQRKMEKSSTGIFSLYLKLYPGRYEIKFIVDGDWRIDPLRPVVNNGGFDNNLLIIT
ncbi:hypothetical protein K2173_021975 [Erythroxylum novogranatense]|uniref:AMP-activated protein kinase glycogen-binding domain-containing protein n=1 Tax=Erythroxylum novogranatense TaxID=1862640 RepID=A0AAV8T2N7_9ROSI|nr:hypothetical protein K2173_021975 [Erythroxylum novogranatense]